MDIFNKKELREKLVNIRRDIHKHPEIRWTEFRTTSLVAKELSSLGYEILLGLDTTTAKGTQ